MRYVIFVLLVIYEKVELPTASLVVINIDHFQRTIAHPAGTSKDSDKCDLSKDSEIAPLTLGSMDNSFLYHLFCFTQESYLSKGLGEIYIWKNL